MAVSLSFTTLRGAASNLVARVLGPVLLGPGSSPAQAASLSVSAINRTKCQTKTGGKSAFGSLVTYTSCQGSAGFGNGVMYNGAVATTGLLVLAGLGALALRKNREKGAN